MLKVSGSQSKRARGLLKWNPRDLSHKARISVNRINNFECGLIHLHQNENKAIYDAFKEEGVVFREYGEVALAEGKKENDEEKHPITQGAEMKRVQVDEEEYRRLTGLEALIPSADRKRRGRKKA